MAKRKSAASPSPAPPSELEAPAPVLAEGRPPAVPSVRVVGVGGSVGSFDAFTQFLKALPDRLGFAIAYVQHIAPDHGSALGQLLAPATKLPVTQLTEDVTIEPDHIYVIAPNRMLVVEKGRLEVRPRPFDRTQHHPIDALFRSLADELNSQTIGVVLSGTGSDGVEGIQAIKAAGGAVLVQDPETAKADELPRAVLATGKVDAMRSPDELAKEVVRLFEAPRVSLPRVSDAAPHLTQSQLERIFALLRSSSGVDFSQYKLPTVQRRIQRRMVLSRLSNFDEYIKLLQQERGEVSQLYQDMLIHVTRFFREPESFDVLSKEVLPQLLAARAPDCPIRVWIPACSTGEEPYSVAMTIFEQLEDRADNCPVQIFATDISDTAIEQARTGLYPPTIAEDISTERLRRFFTKTDGKLRINKPIRDLCVFARQDLTRDPPFSKLDLIVCRNVLIYLSQAIQSKLIRVFHYALKSHGYLVLGSAETIGTQANLFSVADKKHRIYRKKAVESPIDLQFAVPFQRQVGESAVPATDGHRGSGNVQTEANRLILDYYAPPGVIVNDEMQILHFRGQTGRFLEPAPGDASLNLMKMCREGLLHGLRTALQAARKQDRPVRREGLRVKTNGGYSDAAVEVVPLSGAAQGRHYLVLFHELRPTGKSAPAAKAKTNKSARSEYEREIERLQRELVANQQYRQSIIQDLEATNEELQSANEEILSANEELQSTNEELDTAKEELQSTNEELTTLNEELHGRNEELARTNSDLVNLLNGVQIAIVIVSSDLRIRRFTSMAERVMNLIPSDVGRPLNQIKPNFDCPDLEHIIIDVIEKVTAHQRLVFDHKGHGYSLIVRPYKNLDNRIDGAVLALYDTDVLRHFEPAATDAQRLAEAVLNTVRDAVAVIDADLRIKLANPAFLRMFQLQPDEVQAQTLADARIAGGAFGKLKPKLEALLGDGAMSHETTLSFDGEGGPGPRLVFKARRLFTADGRTPQAVVVIHHEGNRKPETPAAS
jgi:two-component system, chemotaxis family, CheB/CheR fusion protein